MNTTADQQLQERTKAVVQQPPPTQPPVQQHREVCLPSIPRKSAEPLHAPSATPKPTAAAPRSPSATRKVGPVARRSVPLPPLASVEAEEAAWRTSFQRFLDWIADASKRTAEEGAVGAVAGEAAKKRTSSSIATPRKRPGLWLESSLADWLSEQRTLRVNGKLSEERRVLLGMAEDAYERVALMDDDAESGNNASSTPVRRGRGRPRGRGRGRGSSTRGTARGGGRGRGSSRGRGRGRSSATTASQLRAEGKRKRKQSSSDDDFDPDADSCEGESQPEESEHEEEEFADPEGGVEKEELPEPWFMPGDRSSEPHQAYSSSSLDSKVDRSASASEEKRSASSPSPPPSASSSPPSSSSKRRRNATSASRSTTSTRKKGSVYSRVIERARSEAAEMRSRTKPFNRTNLPDKQVDEPEGKEVKKNSSSTPSSASPPSPARAVPETDDSDPTDPWPDSMDEAFVPLKGNAGDHDGGHHQAEGTIRMMNPLMSPTPSLLEAGDDRIDSSPLLTPESGHTAELEVGKVKKELAKDITRLIADMMYLEIALESFS